MRSALLLPVLLLGACATRGPIVITDCPDFATYAVPLRGDILTAAIQRDSVPPKAGGAVEAATAAAGSADVPPDSDALDLLLEDALYRAETAGSAAFVVPAADCPGADAPAPVPGMVLLSGGGQWGAFGAGYLKRLHECGKLPQSTFISGVSTGALQSLFLAGASHPKHADAMLARLAASYAPAREDLIVDRGPQWTAVITGSVAGMAPLRHRIEEALCPRADGQPGQGDCDESGMLELLANDATPPTLMGFIDAQTGEFRFVDIRTLAKLGGRTAQQCIVGAALASAAVPLFYQQVRVGERAYMDGGVRQSVFEATIAERAALLAARRAAQSGGGAPAILPLYVVRNGPTIVDEDLDISGQADALHSALRAQGIMVNALEVGSIAALRLRFPEGPANLVTADGWDLGREPGVPACDKKLHDGRERSGQMFNPTFMKCLQRFGAAKADRQEPWITLPTVTQIAEARAEEVRAR